MSLGNPLKQVSVTGAAAPLYRLRDNIAWSLPLFARAPKSVVTPKWRAPLRLAVGTLAGVVIVAITMIALDAPAVTAARQAPAWLIEFFHHITGYGRSVWFLVPIALALTTIAGVTSPSLPRMSRGVLAALAVRLGFLLLAIGLPGLVWTVGKRLIGRARPFVEGGAGPFVYHPLGWSVEYASLPSGHAVDAFAAAMAIGTLWPWTRPVMWTYAVLIAMSRVVLTAHFPSDVMLGAVAGALGALVVRDWYAARRLAFVIGADGEVRPWPGPSFARIKRVAGQLIAP